MKGNFISSQFPLTGRLADSYKQEEKFPFITLRVLTRVSAWGTDTEKRVVHVLCVCLEPK